MRALVAAVAGASTSIALGVVACAHIGYPPPRLTLAEGVPLGVPHCPPKCEQAVAAAEFVAINALDCDNGFDVVGSMAMSDCYDDFNYVNESPRVLSVRRTVSGGYVVRIRIHETTGFDDFFTAVVSRHGIVVRSRVTGRLRSHD